MKRVFKLTTVLLVSLIIFMALLSIAQSTFAPSNEITDLSTYTNIREQWTPSLVNHFPRMIPEQASNVRFAYRPRFMQGGSYMQLRLTLPAKHIQTARQRFEPMATFTFQGDEDIHLKGDTVDMPPPRFYTDSAENDTNFPDTYEVFVLDAQPSGDSDFEWNHGHMRGVAINIAGSEIVYWIEAW